MTAREASIKLTLDDGTFQSSYRQLGSKVKSGAKSMGKGIKSSLGEGFQAAKKEANDLFSTMKSGLGQIATLGGAVSVGAGVRAAVQAQDEYAQLGGILTELTGKTVSYADAQAAVQSAAQGANASLDQTRLVMKGIVGVSGDALELADNTKLAMQMARRLGVEGDFAAESFATLKAHTKASGEETAMMLERISKFGRTKLGLHAMDAINPADIAEWASFAQKGRMSMEGTVQLIEQVPPGIFKDMGQASEFVEEISNGLNDAKGLADITKELKLPEGALSPDVNAFKNLEVLIAKSGTKGIEAAMVAFGNERNMENFRELLGKEMILELSTGTKKEKEMAKLDLLDRVRELAKMTQATADVEGWKTKTAARNALLQETAAARMRTALRKVEIAFESPKMLAAIDKLADKLPALADGIADLVSWVVDNPSQAAATLVLAKVGMVFGGAAMQAAAMGGMKSLMAAITATSGASSIGGTIAAGGAAAAATAAAGVALAAGAGVGAGLIIREAAGTDNAFSNNQAAVRNSMQSTYEAERALKGGDAGSQKQALANVKSALEAIENTNDFVERGIGMLTGSGAGKAREDQTAELMKVQAALIKSIKLELEARDKNTKSTAKNTRATDTNNAAKKTENTPTRGVKESADTTAGADAGAG